MYLDVDHIRGLLIFLADFEKPSPDEILVKKNDYQKEYGVLSDHAWLELVGHAQYLIDGKYIEAKIIWAQEIQHRRITLRGQTLLSRIKDPHNWKTTKEIASKVKIWDIPTIEAIALDVAGEGIDKAVAAYLADDAK